MLHRKQQYLAAKLALLLCALGLSLGLAADPVAAQIKAEQTLYPRQGSRLVLQNDVSPVSPAYWSEAAAINPLSWDRWVWRMNYSQSQAVKTWVNRYRDTSSFVVATMSGALCAAIVTATTAGSATLPAIGIGAFCTLFTGVYWNYLKDAVRAMTAQKPLLEVKEHCNGVPPLGVCYIQIYPVVK